MKGLFHPMNRRDFLDPRRLVQTASQLAGLPDLRAEAGEPEVFLLRFSRQAMATSFEVLMPFGTREATAAGEEALDEIDRLEAQMTVYREDSEVSRLNREAATEPVRVEERLFNLLALAESVHRNTGGAFDISVGALIKAWGFYRRRGRVPSPAERAEVLGRIGMQNVALDHKQRTIFFQRRGLEINLGSIGKGYALDRAGRLLRQRWKIRQALLHGGHSSVLALGSQPGSRRGWPIGIRHPTRPDRRLAVVHLRNRALGTSAATFQNLEYHGRRLGHILDPRSGWPAEAMSSASIIAPSAALADALATAFFVMGVDRALAYCTEHPEIGAILLPAGSSQPVFLGNIW